MDSTTPDGSRPTPPRKDASAPELLRATEEALQECNREPIRTPGSTQFHGVVVVTDLTAREVLAVSANCAEAFGAPPEAILDQSPDDLFGRKLSHTVRNVIGHSTIRIQREQIGTFTPESDPNTSRRAADSWDVAVHVSGESCVVEFVRSDADVARDWTHSSRCRPCSPR